MEEARETAGEVRRVKRRFIAASNRDADEIIKELSESVKDKSPDELRALAWDIRNLPHWFEAEFEERPAKTPGFVERFRAPGTLKDLGPASPEEVKEWRISALTFLLKKKE